MALWFFVLADEKLKAIKCDLYDEMMKRAMNQDTRYGIYDFLARYYKVKYPQILTEK